MILGLYYRFTLLSLCCCLSPLSQVPSTIVTFLFTSVGGLTSQYSSLGSTWSTLRVNRVLHKTHSVALIVILSCYTPLHNAGLFFCFFFVTFNVALGSTSLGYQRMKGHGFSRNSKSPPPPFWQNEWIKEERKQVWRPKRHLRLG